jgi:hypothetical protein
MKNSVIFFMLNLFAYCASNPMMFVDRNGYARTHIIYYNNPASGFATQAKNRIGVGKSPVYMSVISTSNFIKEWNRISDAQNVYLYLHGGTGKLYFKGETMGSLSKLNYRTIKDRVFLFSCYGEAGKEDNNVAWALAKKTNARVIACTGSVSYQKWVSYTYARVSSPATAWYQFYYKNGKAQRTFYAWLMV